MDSNIRQEHVMVESSVFNTTVAPWSDCIYLTKNVKCVPAVFNNSRVNVNCLLNSSSNSEYILLVYDSAAVLSIGRFGMYVTGFFQRDLKSASNSFARRLTATFSHSTRSSERPSFLRNLFLKTLFIPSLLWVEFMSAVKESRYTAAHFALKAYRFAIHELFSRL